jgi:hypothetical protein
MADHRDRLRRELTALALEGVGMLMHEAPQALSADERKSYAATLEKSIRAERRRRRGRAARTERSGDSDELSSLRFQPLSDGYQYWYSRALPVIGQLLPDRYQEFRDLYRLEKRRDVNVMTYTVSDYLQGVSVTSGYGDWARDEFNWRAVGLSRFRAQVEILTSAKGRLDSLLSNISGVLEAELADDELAAARNLLAARQLRSAGVVSGVVLERHLKRVMAQHEISSRRKLTLAVLNDALKDANIYDVPQWRKIQRLADLRNLAAHDGDRDPRADEIEELIDGVAKIVSTVF